MKLITGIFKAIAAAALAVLLTLSAACGGRSDSVKCSLKDGTDITIEWQNSGALSRAPKFTSTGDGVYMTLNNMDRYKASITDASEAEALAEGSLLAESSNIKVYAAEENTVYPYIYLLNMDGTDEGFIRIDYCEDPESTALYGADFDDLISYYCGDVQTLPDVEGLVLKKTENRPLSSVFLLFADERRAEYHHCSENG